MAQQMIEDWKEVERRFAELAVYSGWRPIVAAMSDLVTAIRTDTRFHDLDPSVSHAYLVLRASEKRGVIVAWEVDDGAYKISFVEPGFTLRETRSVPRDAVLDVLLEYLERARR